MSIYTVLLFFCLNPSWYLIQLFQQLLNQLIIRVALIDTWYNTGLFDIIIIIYHMGHIIDIYLYKKKE